MGIGLLNQARDDLAEAARREPRSTEVRAQLQECQKRLQATEQRDRSTFGGMFDRGSIYGEKSKASSGLNLRSAFDLQRLPQVFFRFEVEGRDIREQGRVEFALFLDTEPQAAEQFRLLCQGYSAGSAEAAPSRGYRGSNVQRLVKGSLLQIGNLRLTGDSSIASSSADGDELARESHDRRGLLSVAKEGPDANAMRFFVTLAAAPHLDRKHVVLGEVTAGWEALSSIECLDVDQEGRPTLIACVADCGMVVPPALGRAPGTGPAA